ncbi:adenosine deaminase [Nocardia sp. NPDC051570]|uniref:adenosine deaminase n=1 Tax=Nocardia sp. NPDC051570 TaxID=3364324 RepID=UPI0037B2CC56
MRDLSSLPKANLHLHLTGAMRRETMRELAAQRGLEPPDLSDARSPTGFQRAYDGARAVIQTATDIRRIVGEAAVDDARDGARWIEIQVDPTSYVDRFGSLRGATEIVLDAAAAATTATGVGIGIIIAASWTYAPEHVIALAELAADYADDGVVGFGVSNDERQGHVPDFAPACRVASAAGLRIVPHSGAVVPAAHVADCVNLLGAHRIGHGLAAARDRKVLTLLASRGVVVELCPSSYPGLIVATAADIPLRVFLEAGVSVALGSDDPLLFGGGLADQYRITRTELGLTDRELADLARASIVGSCAPIQVKRSMQEGVDTWVAAPDPGT